MAFTYWMLVIGALLVLMAMSGSILKRLPLSTSLLYLVAGYWIGPGGINLLAVDARADAAFIERGAEIAVLISLFASGLKLKVSPRNAYWRLSVRLAFGSMFVTVGLLAVAAMWGLALPLGAAILLGAMLAPTDPVLASDVQLQQPGDRDRVRFCLTSEAALNDGAAFPFVMLGLGLLGLHELGDYGVRWFAVDVIWASFGGLAIGALIGALVGRLILYLRIRHREAVGLDEFLMLGVIALSYGLALLLHAYGFLAVFAAGYALQRLTVLSTHSNQNARIDNSARKPAEDATHPATAPEHMASEVLGFNEQLERIGEVAIMLLVGALLSMVEWSWEKLAFVIFLFVVVRPVSVAIGLFRTRTELTTLQRGLIAWFGIRGIGSIYYLYFALKHPLPDPVAKTLFDLTLIAIAASVVLHGISVTPLMRNYSQTDEGRA
jgi:NhaP-type Na+/H+ or K+/H+ antiporter